MSILVDLEDGSLIIAEKEEETKWMEILGSVVVSVAKKERESTCQKWGEELKRERLGLGTGLDPD